MIQKNILFSLKIPLKKTPKRNIKNNLCCKVKPCLQISIKTST